MAFIGNTTQTQNFVPAVDYFSGNGSTTAFTLSRPVASVVQVEAVISNVVQNPSSAYSVSGNTITFTSAPPSGTNNIYVRYTSPVTQVIGPSQGTVYPSSLSTGGMYWDTSSNVGIGTISPTDKLVVNTTLASSTDQGGIRLYVSGTAFGALYGTGSAYNYAGVGANETWLYSGGRNLNIGSDGAYATKFVTNGSERMRIDSSGNVTIGGVGILGIGQSWSDVTASRALGTTYTNSTGKPIQVMMCFASTSTTSRTQTAVVNGVTIFSQTSNYVAETLNFIVPSGATYSITSTGLTLGTWSELR